MGGFVKEAEKGGGAFVVEGEVFGVCTKFFGVAEDDLGAGAGDGDVHARGLQDEAAGAAEEFVIGGGKAKENDFAFLPLESLNGVDGEVLPDVGEGVEAVAAKELAEKGNLGAKGETIPIPDGGRPDSNRARVSSAMASLSSGFRDR